MRQLWTNGACLTCNNEDETGGDCNLVKDTNCSKTVNQGRDGKLEKLPLSLKLKFVGSNHNIFKFVGNQAQFLNDVSDAYTNLKLIDITENKIIGTILSYESTSKKIYF